MPDGINNKEKEYQVCFCVLRCRYLVSQFAIIIIAIAIVDFAAAAAAVVVVVLRKRNRVIS